MSLAVVLMSGGMDSTVCAAIAQNMGFKIAALHVNYEQRTQARELRAFHEVADYFKAETRLIVDISYLKAIGGSSLVDKNMDMPKADLTHEGVPTTYVPFRNGNMLAIATSWAEVLKAKAIFIGAVEEDSSGYPDCREEFYKAFQTVIDAGTKPETRVEIITPLIHLSKREIVLKGTETGAPLNLTWSCYQSEDKACGECDSCALRLRGFKQAGVEDPIEYVKRPEYF
jgi:7-cyano-7-deazaguanine synthase